METVDQDTESIGILADFNIDVVLMVDFPHLQLTQANVAEQAGIAKRTLERIEAGHSAQMSNLIRLLRVLDGLPGLDGLIPEAGPRPMDLLKRKGKVRQRASKLRPSDQPGKPWTWGDES